VFPVRYNPGIYIPCSYTEFCFLQGTPTEELHALSVKSGQPIICKVLQPHGAVGLFIIGVGMAEEEHRLAAG
jgi:hypothetical protein